jgi:hypothetical protein
MVKGQNECLNTEAMCDWPNRSPEVAMGRVPTELSDHGQQKRLQQYFSQSENKLWEININSIILTS